MSGSEHGSPSIEWSLTAVADVLAESVGDRPMLVREDTRRTFAEVAERTRRLATFLVAQGIGLRTERAGLARWECGQSPVAVVMHNRPEYVESMYAAFRARAVPFNVNQHYRPAEIRALFDMVGVEAVVYERSLAATVGAALDGLDPVLIEVDDGSGGESLPGAVDYEEVIASTEPGDLPDPSGDDLAMVCTGGTTGSPKAVLWRQADLFVSAMGGTADASAASIISTAESANGAWFSAAPLMHAAAQWTIFSGLHGGNTAVLHDDSAPFDADAVLRVVERERVSLMSIVGDAFARPMIDALRDGDYDLSALAMLGTGGAVTSESVKVDLLEVLPHVLVVEGYGASETGGMAYGASAAGAVKTTMAPSLGAVVLSQDRERLLEPGDGEIGWAARRGRVPLGYLGDPERTEATFPVIDGERFAVPGDRARLSADGEIELLGRDAMVVNSGGEKVFVEEVEEVLRTHPDVADALVVGRPSDRFGQEVVGVVELLPDTQVSPAALRAHCAGSLARFKAPRAIAFTEQIGRHRSGKPDYAWALEAAADAIDATGRSDSAQASRMDARTAPSDVC